MTSRFLLNLVCLRLLYIIHMHDKACRTPRQSLTSPQTEYPAFDISLLILQNSHPKLSPLFLQLALNNSPLCRFAPALNTIHPNNKAQAQDSSHIASTPQPICQTYPMHATNILLLCRLSLVPYTTSQFLGIKTPILRNTLPAFSSPTLHISLWLANYTLRHSLFVQSSCITLPILRMYLPNLRYTLPESLLLNIPLSPMHANKALPLCRID